MKRLRCEQDDFSSNRHPALAFCLRMSFFAKPVPTFAGRALAILLLMVVSAAAQTYPDRPIRLLVGFAAGGPADISARVLGDRFAEAWGQPVVVENITGAAGNLATERVAKAAPDGYTLLLAASATIVTNPSLYQKLAFDPVNDLAPISQVCFTPNLLVVPGDLAVKSVKELVAYARAQPGTLTFGSAGVGTSQHLAGELFKTMAGIDIQHVPYRGIAAVMPDLLGGRLTMAFGNISAVLPMVRAGKLRALAVTSPGRSASVPNLPTMIEEGFAGFDSTAWFALMAPAGTPEPVIAKLHREAARILALPEVRKRFDELGMEVIGNTPAEFAAVIKAETPQWAKVIREAGIKANE
jgi:tripartite-type tricarboxylate transporter receptor subunit TctC